MCTRRGEPSTKPCSRWSRRSAAISSLLMAVGIWSGYCSVPPCGRPMIASHGNTSASHRIVRSQTSWIHQLPSSCRRSSPIPLPRLGPIPPSALKRVLELDGFSIAHEDDYNWALARDGVEDVVIVPKLGPVVAEDVLLRVVMTTPRRPTQYLFPGRLVSNTSSDY